MKKNIIIIIGAIILLIDQLIKFIFIRCMAFNTSISLIDNFFNITLVKNEGAAFSLFSGMQFLLIIIAILLLIVIYKVFIKDALLKKHDIVVFGVLIGGIIGNLIDRIVYNGVIDYLDFNILGYNAPIFNFADICIVLTMFILIIKEAGGIKHENK